VKHIATVATDIHDGSHAVVTSVPAGTVVHDRAVVSGSAGTPAGTVTFKWYLNGTCTDPPAATSSALPLAGGAVDATGFAQTPAFAGNYSFMASYSGDGVYGPKDGPCELLAVVSPNLADLITTMQAPNPVLPGSSIIITVKTHNVGKGTAAKSKTVLYLSTDQAVGPADLKIATIPLSLLKSGKIHSASIRFTVPALPAGAYWLISVGDNENSVLETRENNNYQVRELVIK
jgi:hypothetical protein